MNRTLSISTFAAGLLIAATCLAQAPAGAPAGSTGACKDGTYTSAANKKGACQGHKGVKEWYGSAATAAAPAPAAAAPAAAPARAAGATGLCKDGTTTSAANKKGACQGHQGVKEWYGTAAAPTAAPAPAKAAAPAAAAPAIAAPAPAPASPAPRASSAPPAVAAPGGGPGLVWVNKSSKVYHCQGDEWYGKTKSGAYMSEADAKAQGYRPERGKTCTQ